MSDKKEKPSFSERLQEILEKEKELQKRISDKNKRKRQAYKEGRKRYLKWKESKRAECEKAAEIILEWVGDFTASEKIEELAKLERLKRRKKFVCPGESSKNQDVDLKIWISRRISYEHPSYRGIIGEEIDTDIWLLLIDYKKKKLRAHNSVKYGRSYEVDSVEKLLERVEHPVLLEVARTIEEGEIESIILEWIEPRKGGER